MYAPTTMTPLIEAFSTMMILMLYMMMFGMIMMMMSEMMKAMREAFASTTKGE